MPWRTIQAALIINADLTSVEVLNVLRTVSLGDN